MGPATDVYALGLVLYELATGKHPICPEAGEYTTAEMVGRTFGYDPPPLVEVVPGFPEDLSAIAARAVAKKPGDRFRTMAEMRDALEEALMRYRRAHHAASLAALDGGTDLDGAAATKWVPPDELKAGAKWVTPEDLKAAAASVVARVHTAPQREGVVAPVLRPGQGGTLRMREVTPEQIRALAGAGAPTAVDAAVPAAAVPAPVATPPVAARAALPSAGPAATMESPSPVAAAAAKPGRVPLQVEVRTAAPLAVAAPAPAPIEREAPLRAPAVAAAQADTALAAVLPGRDEDARAVAVAAGRGDVAGAHREVFASAPRPHATRRRATTPIVGALAGVLLATGVAVALKVGRTNGGGADTAATATAAPSELRSAPSEAGTRPLPAPAGTAAPASATVTSAGSAPSATASASAATAASSAAQAVSATAPRLPPPKTVPSSKTTSTYTGVLLGE